MMKKVALVNMPFASAGYPAIGISLLQAALRRREIDCDLHYLNLNFASLIGLERYLWISESFAPYSCWRMDLRSCLVWRPNSPG